MKVVPVILSPLLVCFVLSKDVVFNCNGDWCNVESWPQFCSEAFRHCRDCKEIRQECGTATQPRNCTAYCQDLAVQIASQEKRRELDDSCLVLPMLLNLVNGNVQVSRYNGSRIPTGFELKYTCNDGYQLEGDDTNTCLGNDTWSHTTLPHCFDISWIDYRHAVIVLGVIVALLLTLIIAYCAIKRCRLCKEKNDHEMPRNNTDSSISGIQAPLLEGIQDVNNEDETSPLTMGTPRTLPRDHGHDVATPATPTAPPEEGNSGNEQPGTGDGKRSDHDDAIRGPNVIVHNHFMINNTNIAAQPNDGNNKSDSAEANSPNDDVPRRNDVKSIDMKFATEESNDYNEHNSGANASSQENVFVTEETKNDKKRKGTKPLPARGIAKQTDDNGPEVVAAKEDDGQSPTKETEQDDESAQIGINSVTFAKSDIKGKGKQTAAERNAAKESEDDSSAKAGISKVTSETTDMVELKS